MFIHNINPVALTLGPIEIRYYGIVYFIGFLFAYFFLKHQIKKARIKNFGLEDLDTFMIYFMLGAIIGARVLNFVFYYPEILITKPLEIFKVWHGGMSIHGGIIGTIIAGLLYVRNKKVKFYDLADQVIIPLMFFLGLGRIANFINGELWGTPSTARICIDYTQSNYIINPPQECRHPYQLYESIKNFAVGITLLIYKSYTTLKKGLLFWYGILLYNAARFFLDFYRDEAIIYIFTMGQYLCLILSIIAIIFIIKIRENQRKRQ